MLRLSKKADYALMAMKHLAARHDRARLETHRKRGQIGRGERDLPGLSVGQYNGFDARPAPDADGGFQFNSGQ